MDFDDGSRAVINDDFSVTYTDSNGSTIISGFPSRADAQSFCYFGDFDQKKQRLCFNYKTRFFFTLDV